MTSLAALLNSLVSAAPGQTQSPQAANAPAGGLFASLLSADGESARAGVLPGLSGSTGGARPGAPLLKGLEGLENLIGADTAGSGDGAVLSEGAVERLAAAIPGVTPSDIEALTARAEGLTLSDLEALAAGKGDGSLLAVLAALKTAAQTGEAPANGEASAAGPPAGATTGEAAYAQAQAKPGQATAAGKSNTAQTVSGVPGQASNGQPLTDGQQGQPANAQGQAAGAAGRTAGDPGQVAAGQSRAAHTPAHAKVGAHAAQEAGVNAQTAPEAAATASTARASATHANGLETALVNASGTGLEKGLQTALTRLGQGATRGERAGSAEARTGRTSPAATFTARVNPGSLEPASPRPGESGPGQRAATTVMQLMKPAAGGTLIQLHEHKPGDPVLGMNGDTTLQTLTMPARAAPPAPPGQAPQVPVGALAVHIAQQAQNGVKRFDIRLDPPELGNVRIRLDVAQDGKVTTHLIVERTETLDLLQRDARHLERALQDAGLDTSKDGLKFSLKDQGLAHGGARDGGSGKDAAAPERAEPGTDDTATGDEDAAAVQAQGNYVATGGLDIRI